MSAFSSFVAKYRPGLATYKGSVRQFNPRETRSTRRRGNAPSVAPVPEREVIRRRARVLVLCPLRVALGLVHAREAERIERARVGVHRVVEVHRVRRGGDERACGDERAVGEGDVLEDLTVEGNYGARRLAGTEKGSVRDVRVLTPFNRCDSRMKLSSFHIFPMLARVQPSAETMGSTSSRRGLMYSVSVARW